VVGEIQAGLGHLEALTFEEKRAIVDKIYPPSSILFFPRWYLKLGPGSDETLTCFSLSRRRIEQSTIHLDLDLARAGARKSRTKVNKGILVCLGVIDEDFYEARKKPSIDKLKKLLADSDFFGETGKKVNLAVMKKPILRYVLLVSFLLLHTQGAWGEGKFPKPAGLINDFAGVIPQSEKQKMQILSTEVLQKTGTAVVVATVPTIGDEDDATYTNELYQAWGIGKKGEDKGVLIFLALKERRIRIETGYGVEGILPDGRVGEILDKYAVPLLKKDRYGEGLYNALAAVSLVVAKDANVELTGEVKIYRPPQRQVRLFRFFPLIFIILILFSFLRRGRGGILPLLLLGSLGGRGGFGGGFGGFGGGFGGFGGGMSGGGGAGRGF